MTFRELYEHLQCFVQHVTSVDGIETNVESIHCSLNGVKVKLTEPSPVLNDDDDNYDFE